MVRVVAVVLLVVAAFVGCEPTEASAVINLDHIVGGSLGWSLPPNTSYYQEWAKNKTFVVGDTLVFMYTSALQNVMEVSKEDFDGCTDKKIINWYYAGPTLLKLDRPAPLYLYCGIGTHCEAGQKLAINVTATAGPDPARDGLPPPPGSVGTAAPIKSSGGSVAAAACLPPSLPLYLVVSMFI